MEVCFQPTSYFRRMPREGAYGAVLAYYLVIGVVVAGVHLFWDSVLDTSALRNLILARIGADAMPQSNGLVAFLLSPLLLLCLLYLATGVAHLMLLIVRGAKNGFGTTTRVFAFSYSPALCAVVPFVGGLAGMVWMFVLAIIGLREAHQTTTGRAATAVLLPFILTFVLVILLAIAAVAIGLMTTRI